MSVEEKELQKLEQVKHIGPKTARTLLLDKKITFERLATMRPGELSSILNISKKLAKEVIIEAKHLMFKKLDFMNAQDYQRKVDETRWYLSTGSQEIDDLFGGKGIPSCSTLGLSGPSSTGKTQILLQLTLNTVLQDKYAVFIETEAGTFSLSRLMEMAENRKVADRFDPRKIIVVPAHQIKEPYSQFVAYEFIRQKAKELKLDIGLICVDSFTAKFRRFYGGREMFPDRSSELARHIDFLEDWIKETNSIVALSCQVMEVPDTEGTVYALLRFGSRYVPWGGHSLIHNIAFWFSLLEVKRNLWKAFLWDSSYRPRGEAFFLITKKGIESPKTTKIKGLDAK